MISIWNWFWWREYAPLSIESIIGIWGSGYLIYLLFFVTTESSKSHQHPAHVEDIAEALIWTFANIEKYGGDSHKVFLCK